MASRPDNLSLYNRHDRGRVEWQATYGVRFLVVPPVGPAVPDSQTVYVLSSFGRTFSASLETTPRVGPE